MRGGAGVLAEKKFLVAEFLDGVAELGGFFEFEFFGGFAHFGFEPGDVGVEFGLGGEFGHFGGCFDFDVRRSRL